LFQKRSDVIIWRSQANLGKINKDYLGAIEPIDNDIVGMEIPVGKNIFFLDDLVSAGISADMSTFFFLPILPP